LSIIKGAIAPSI